METTDVPLKERSMWEPRDVALVPPLRTGRTPLTWLVRETVPPRFERLKQLLLILKQPAASEMPSACVDVAAPVTFRFSSETLPVNVLVAGEPKVAAPVDPLNVSAGTVEVARYVDVAI